MTTNKFWTVGSHSIILDSILFTTEEEAIKKSHSFAELYPGHEFFVMEAIWSHKAVTTTINKVVETPLHQKQPEPMETSTVEHKFKIGDKVNHAVHGIGWIYECNSGLNYTDSKFKDFKNVGGYFAREDELTFADIESPKPKFKVGDIVEVDCLSDNCKIINLYEDGDCYLYTVSELTTGNTYCNISEFRINPVKTKDPTLNFEDITLDTGLFFVENSTKVIEHNILEYLKSVNPEHFDFLYSVDYSLSEVKYCNVWFELNGKSHKYHLNKTLSNENVTVLSYIKDK